MTILGCYVNDVAGGVGYNRTALSTNIASQEAAIQTQGTDPTFVNGLNRGHYFFMDNSSNGRWPLTGQQSMNIDRPLNRLPIVSHKMGTGSWANTALASPTVQTAIYANIVATGNAIASWQTANAGLGKWGKTFIWAFHHECNQNTTMTNEGPSDAQAAANWRNAAANILSIWQNVCGVTIWQGSTANDFTTTTEGLIFALCTVGGAWSGGNTIGNSFDNDFDVFWPAGNAFMDANCRAWLPDAYNGTSHTFYYSFQSIMQLIKSKSDTKRTSQNAAGRPFFVGSMEVGCSELAHFTSGEGPDGSWTAQGLGAFTKAKWLANMASYIKNSWNNYSLFSYYDTYQLYPDNILDSTTAAWNAWIQSVANDPYFNIASDSIGSTPPSSTTNIRIIDDGFA